MEIYTIKETADILKVSEKTIYNCIKENKLKAIKVGRAWRIDKKDLESFIEAKKNKTI